jgi:hypothetical protein
MFTIISLSIKTFSLMTLSTNTLNIMNYLQQREIHLKNIQPNILTVTLGVIVQSVVILNV